MLRDIQYLELAFFTLGVCLSLKSLMLSPSWRSPPSSLKTVAPSPVLSSLDVGAIMLNDVKCISKRCFIQGAAAGCVQGFKKCFPRVPQAVGLYCSCCAAQASRGNFQKTLSKTLCATCCCTLYTFWLPLSRDVLFCYHSEIPVTNRAAQ